MIVEYVMVVLKYESGDSTAVFIFYDWECFIIIFINGIFDNAPDGAGRSNLLLLNKWYILEWEVKERKKGKWINGMNEKFSDAPDGGAQTKQKNIIIMVINGMNEYLYGAPDGGAERQKIFYNVNVVIHDQYLVIRFLKHKAHKNK